ncbi:MAG TPA: penicillin-binding protein 1C, partial [Cytophagales bacterium]|nr:penicillin-binding protein 1C [Cytophagales bacterium]
LSCVLAKDEPLPGIPLPLPQDAPSLLTRCVKEGLAGQRIYTTLDARLQRRAKALVNRHHDRLRGNQVFNAAALILDTETGAALAYVGNADMQDAHLHGGKVDIIPAPRSTGSILKPFLYAGMLHEGSLLPNMLLPDVPTVMQGFAPQNFNRQFDGAVPARRALARSLNVPSVHMLRNYGIPNFHQLLQRAGLTTLTQAPMHYGLSLILGGAEGSLWDITGTYASMARTLQHYFDYPVPHRYDPADWRSPYFLPKQATLPSVREDRRANGLLDAGSLYLTFQAMLEVYRPDEEANWQRFSSSRRIAWKTGTSYGFRDAWAVGVTPEYVVGVWAGNADGEGRPGLVGISSAGPLLFDLYDLLPSTTWFESPNSNLIPLTVCAESGYRNSPICPHVDTLLVPPTASRSEACPYHQTIHLDPSQQYRVHSDCQPVSQMVHQAWFTLPPAMEWYYKSKSQTYQLLPPWRTDCQDNPSVVQASMEIIYPKDDAALFIPTELDGQPGRVVFEVAHRRPRTEIHWHMDDTYLGTTRSNHTLELNPDEGFHNLTLVDENGELLTYRFEVLSKRR